GNLLLRQTRLVRQVTHGRRLGHDLRHRTLLSGCCGYATTQRWPSRGSVVPAAACGADRARIGPGASRRMPRCKPEPIRRGEPSIRSEACVRVLDDVERARLVVTGIGVDVEDTVRGRALRRNSAEVADETAQLARRNELAVARAGGCRDALVDERPAQVVGPRVQQQLGELRPFLDPGALDVADG